MVAIKSSDGEGLEAPEVSLEYCLGHIESVTRAGSRLIDVGEWQQRGDDWHEWNC
jgi:hypothetical protein